MADENENKPAPAPNTGGAAPNRVRIFTYPKIIFIVPTLIAALVCGIGMMLISDRTDDPKNLVALVDQDAGANTVKTAEGKTVVKESPKSRFGSTQNVLAMSFLLVLALNLLIMSIDFPRFTVIALVLLFASLGFFILWLNVYFELLPPLVAVLENIYAAANSTFYFLIATVIFINFAIILGTRYLDYWEVLPNEILHNHGPFSDLERFTTWNLKFDKEIPDILEYALLRSGRLVLHIPNERKAIVLDNVLWINSKEEELKRLLSRMEVRVTTDREVADETM